jgi:hypothetical protein
MWFSEKECMKQSQNAMKQKERNFFMIIIPNNNLRQGVVLTTMTRAEWLIAAGSSTNGRSWGRSWAHSGGVQGFGLMNNELNQDPIGQLGKWEVHGGHLLRQGPNAVLNQLKSRTSFPSARTATCKAPRTSPGKVSFSCTRRTPHH